MTIVIVGLVALLVVAAFWDRAPATREFDDITALRQAIEQRAALRRVSTPKPDPSSRS